MQKTEALLQPFKTISLEEMDKVKLLNRVDTKYIIPEDYVDTYYMAKELFMMHRDKLNVDELPFIKSEIDKTNLYSYLVDECNLPDKNITNAIKKLNNIY